MVSSNSTNKSRKRNRLFYSHAAFFLLGCCFATIVLNIFHAAVIHDHDADTHLDHFADKHMRAVDQAAVVLNTEQEHVAFDTNTIKKASIEKNTIKKIKKSTPHSDSIAGLNCDAFGGPPQEFAQEMVYWKDIEEDNGYISPFYDPAVKRYMTFEPDGGGWNNIRMSMETVLTMAVATGRTLVLPPSQRMYLLGSVAFSFADFFPLHKIANEIAGLDVISMQDFLERVAPTINEPLPGNKTDWGGDTNGVRHELNPWLQKIAYSPDWDPTKCLASFPASVDQKDTDSMQSTFNTVLMSPPQIESYVNKPTPVNASMKNRFAENLAGRKELCLYDSSLQQEPFLHFHGKKHLGARLLVHFYAFLFFQNWKEDLWMKRFVRDHLRYIDEIQCAAARVVAAVREHSKSKGNNGVFDSFHIRRGDFQYKKTRLEAQEIYENSKDEIPEKTTVYVGTDERKKDFFKDMAAHWDVVYLDDFMHLIEGVDKNYYGMIDQLVASRGRTFFGCWFSTFSGYINRLRGYHSVKDHLDGYELGVIDSYYYALLDHKTKMKEFWPVKQLFYAREYPASWRSIDLDVKTKR